MWCLPGWRYMMNADVKILRSFTNYIWCFAWKHHSVSAICMTNATFAKYSEVKYNVNKQYLHLVWICLASYIET